jgi:hypothetical protein
LPGTRCTTRRTRRDPDRTTPIRHWFAESGCTELAFDTAESFFGVGTHRFTGEPLPFDPDVRLFEFQ